MGRWRERWAGCSPGRIRRLGMMQRRSNCVILGCTSGMDKTNVATHPLPNPPPASYPLYTSLCAPEPELLVICGHNYALNRHSSFDRIRIVFRMRILRSFSQIQSRHFRNPPRPDTQSCQALISNDWQKLSRLTQDLCIRDSPARGRGPLPEGGLHLETHKCDRSDRFAWISAAGGVKERGDAF